MFIPPTRTNLAPEGAMGEGIAVSLIAIALTFILLRYQRRVIARTGSVAIKTDNVHYKSDLMLNGAVIAALVLEQALHIAGADAFFGIGISLWLLWGAWRNRIDRTEPMKFNNLLICAIFFFAYFGFIVFTYLTKNNTDIWPRYGLILFSLGLPMLAYSAQQFFKRRYAAAQAIFGIAIFAGLVQIKTQTEDFARFITQKTRPEAIANYLRQEYANDPSIRIFCDSPEVRVMSGIPGDHFYHSFFEGLPKDPAGFIGFLRAKHINFLMVPEEDETSTPSQLFPPGQIKSTGVFEELIPPPDERRADSLYRVREMKAPSS